MSAAHWSDALVRLHACGEAVEWARTQPDYATAWATCERGDWMLWLAGKLAGPPGDDSRRPLVLAACACARLTFPMVPNGEARPRVAIETAEAWARGEEGVTLGMVRRAAWSAVSYAAAYAVYAAAYADADADAAWSAVSYAAAYAADADAQTTTLRECADIVRVHYPTPPELPQ